MNLTCIFHELCCPANYEPIIRKKYAKLIHDVAFADYAHGTQNVEEIAEKLAAEVRSKTYMPGFVSPKKIFFLAGGRRRKRNVYPLQAKDLIIFTLLEQLLLRCLNPQDFANVYSNILGKNFLHAVRQLGKTFKANTKDGKIDLYIMNSDISKFYDSVPVDQKSILWDQLKSLYESHTNREHIPYVSMLIEFGVHPFIAKDHSGSFYQNIIGLPTGSPLAGVLSDIYLKPLDQFFTQIPNSCYVRYVDDVIFIHPQAETILDCAKKAQTILEGMRLNFNLTKTQYFYLTRCGRRSPVKGFQGRDFIDFLECRIHANGVISASNKNVRKLLRNIRRRLAATLRLMNPVNEPTWRDKLPVLIKTVNASLSPRNPLHLEVVDTILKKSDDRQQMRFLDRQILLLLGQHALGKKGVKILRTLSFRQILAYGPVFSFSRYKNGKKNELPFE